ncbi:MAG: ribonuclease activity regulator RraA [Pseudomonadota bacterium]
MTSYSDELLNNCRSVSTATLTTVMFKMGVVNTWIRGAFPISGNGERVAGPAFTLRFIPAREDLATPASWSSSKSTRMAVEAMPDGCIAVVGADACSDAGIFGDILCQRMKCRNVLALVTDGVVRDLAGIEETQLGVWANGAASPAAVASLTFANWQEPIGCGGVAIFPDDLIVADRDGAVVVPQAMVDTVIEAALEMEVREEWILEQVKNGAELPGLYPLNDENERRFEEARRHGSLPESR